MVGNCSGRFGFHLKPSWMRSESIHLSHICHFGTKAVVENRQMHCINVEFEKILLILAEKCAKTNLNGKISFQPPCKCCIYAFQCWICAGVVECQTAIGNIKRILTNNVITIQNVLATVIHQSCNFPCFRNHLNINNSLRFFRLVNTIIAHCFECITHQYNWNHR